MLFATCGHKAEWVCSSCGSCASCDRCEADPPAMVHVNTKEAAIAIARWAKKKRAEFDRARANGDGGAGTEPGQNRRRSDAPEESAGPY